MKLEPLEELRKRAAAGDVDAQIRMGNRYLCGVTVEVDLDEAAKWFLLAGKSGSADGFMSLGLHYSGSAKPRDVAKAMHFTKRPRSSGTSMRSLISAAFISSVTALSRIT